MNPLKCVAAMGNAFKRSGSVTERTIVVITQMKMNVHHLRRAHSADQISCSAKRVTSVTLKTSNVTVPSTARIKRTKLAAVSGTSNLNLVGKPSTAVNWGQGCFSLYLLLWRSMRGAWLNQTTCLINSLSSPAQSRRPIGN